MRTKSQMLGWLVFSLSLVPQIVQAKALTCLTGTNPVVSQDQSRIAYTINGVNQACLCNAYDGSKGKTHKAYNACVAAVVKTYSEAPVNALRPQCKATVKNILAKSTCGVNPTRKSAPCIRTLVKTGKVTCSIKPTLKKDGITPTDACTSSTKATRVSCAFHHRCMQAADTNDDLFISAPGDSGECTLPPGNYRQTCSDCVVNGNVLSCTCLDVSQEPYPTSLDLPCNGEIKNSNAVLICTP